VQPFWRLLNPNTGLTLLVMLSLLQQRASQLNVTNCAEYDRLSAYVTDCLEKLRQLTTSQLDLFRAGEYAACRRVDKELELSVGAKERGIGALRQHMIEHKCQGREPI
jgi:hypothetical protein